MYITKLCCRYLITRKLLEITILCVMLGVAVLIVVNGVMSGFAHEMRDRMHGVMSDVTLESWSASGFPDAQQHMDRIRKVCGDKIASMTPLCQTQGLVSFQIGQEWIHQPVIIIGIDPNGENESKDFGQYFQHPLNREKLSFKLREDGYEQSADPNRPRLQLRDAGWRYRRTLTPPPEVIREPIQNPGAELQKIQEKEQGRQITPPMGMGSQPMPMADPTAVRTVSGNGVGQTGVGQIHQTNYPPVSTAQAGNVTDGTVSLPDLPADPHAENAKLEQQSGTDTNTQPGGFVSQIDNDPVTEPQKDASGSAVNDPFNQFRKPENVRVFDPRKEQHTGIIMGISLVSVRREGGEERFYCWPGKDVKLTMASASMPPKGITDNFTVVDIYESKMSEFDSQFVFIPLDAMQRLRAMFDPISNKGMVNAIRIRLKDENDGPLVRDLLKEEFNSGGKELYKIQTWQDQRSNLLAAVEMERSLLNVLLFLIICVCGFSITTIFLMIVSEKFKDIGILRALGASSSGIMMVFLNYGFLLGVVGSILGVFLGFYLLDKINTIADGISYLTGHSVFDPEIYYFYQIPTNIESMTIVWIVIGTICVTVLASAFPAWRAASMQPVDSLRS